MVAPVVAGALVSGGSSILGGIFGDRRAKKRQDRQNAYNAPKAIRKRAEEGGFNPLLFVGPGVGNQAQPVPTYMGQAIANAGMALADGMSENERLKLERSKLEVEREKLRELVQRNTIRPKVAGIYATTQKTPTLGGVGGTAASAAAAPFEPEEGSGGIDGAGNPVTGYSMGGVLFDPDGSWSDTEQIETRLGDPVSWLYGMGVGIADFHKNVGKPFFEVRKANKEARRQQELWKTRVRKFEKKEEAEADYRRRTYQKDGVTYYKSPSDPRHPNYVPKGWKPPEGFEGFTPREVGDFQKKKYREFIAKHYPQAK